MVNTFSPRRHRRGQWHNDNRRTRRQKDGSYQQDVKPPMAAIKVDYAVHVTGFGRLASRKDVQRLLPDIHLPTDDIRVEYDQDTLHPKSFWINVPTHEIQQRAASWDGVLMGGRAISVKAADRDAMRQAILNPLSMGSRGRYLLVSGVQENANLEDIVRFFEGYQLMGNPVTVMRQSGPMKKSSGRVAAASLRAVVRFTTPEEAYRAQREKQQGFLLNTAVTLRVLQ